MRHLWIFFLGLFSLSAFGMNEVVCDPENTAFFVKSCGEVPDKSEAGIKKIPLWQNTYHPGYQLIDCKNGTIKNVFEKSGQSYSCRVPVNK